jgi:hypothetical protein
MDNCPSVLFFFWSLREYLVSKKQIGGGDINLKINLSVDTACSLFDLKNIVRYIFSVRHYKFMNLSVIHRTVSTGQKNRVFLFTRHCAVSKRQIHKFIVFHR